MSGTWTPVYWKGRFAHEQKNSFPHRFQLLSYSFLWGFNLLILWTCLCFPYVSWHSLLNMLTGYCGHCCRDLCGTNKTICWVNLSLYMPFHTLIAWDHAGKAATGLPAVPSCDFRRCPGYRRSSFAGWNAKLMLWTLVTFEDRSMLSLMRKAWVRGLISCWRNVNFASVCPSLSSNMVNRLLKCIQGLL